VILIESGRLFNASRVIGGGMSILSAGAAMHYTLSAVNAYGNAAGSSEQGKLLLCCTSVDDARTVLEVPRPGLNSLFSKRPNQELRPGPSPP
jgi:hypothetical protein